MNPLTWLTLVLALSGLQASSAPAYVTQGNRVESRFRFDRDMLSAFYKTLHAFIESVAPDLMPALEGEPPRAVVYGYQLLPKILDTQPGQNQQVLEPHSYSWPLTEGYIEGEEVKLKQVRQQFRGLTDADSDDARHELLQKVAQNYRNLVANQRVIDQFVEYNRFWQREVADDRTRFDQLTQIYQLLQQHDPDTTKAIIEALGKPAVPAFVQVIRPNAHLTILRVPLYTDIQDEAFLTQFKSIVESFWQADDGDSHYGVEVELRRISAGKLYGAAVPPETGVHIEIRSHVDRFPTDGAVLTTGAESTYSGVGRYIALAIGDIYQGSIAHEFGHLLGFRDGYIRGYTDLGKDGFEIMEIIPSLDDIMSAPGMGRVLATHFKLLLGNLPPI